MFLEQGNSATIVGMKLTQPQGDNMSLVKTNDLKKGARIQLSNGWYATIQDNRKGDTRIATVEGFVTETGSVYAHDIVQAEMGGTWVPVQHTAKQVELKNRVTMWGF